MDFTPESLEASLTTLAGLDIQFCPHQMFFRMADLLQMQRLLPTYGVAVRRSSGPRSRRQALKSRATRRALFH